MVSSTKGMWYGSTWDPKANTASANGMNAQAPSALPKGLPTQSKPLQSLTLGSWEPLKNAFSQKNILELPFFYAVFHIAVASTGSIQFQEEQRR